MKLSKAQLEVVDKMREGWTLKCSSFSGAYIIKSTDRRIDISRATISALLKQGVIINTADSTNYAAIYQLTEKYRTNGTETKPGL